MLDSAENYNGDGFSKGRTVSIEFDEADKRQIKVFAEVLEEFTTRRGNIPALHIVMMLRVALDEGKSQIYYSNKWGVPPATVSRVMLDLGKKMRLGQPGLGLIEEQTSTRSLREHEVYLSIAGRTLLKKAMKRLCR